MIAILTQTVNVACTFEKCHLSIFREQHSVRILNTYHFSWNVSLFLTSMHVERIASEFILEFPLLCANDGNRFNSRIQQLQVYTFWIPRIHYLFNKFTKQSQKENLKSNCGQNNIGWERKKKQKSFKRARGKLLGMWFVRCTQDEILLWIVCIFPSWDFEIKISLRWHRPKRKKKQRMEKNTE